MGKYIDESLLFYSRIENHLATLQHDCENCYNAVKLEFNHSTNSAKIAYKESNHFTLNTYENQNNRRTDDEGGCQMVD